MHDHGRSHSARLLGKLSLPATMSSATFLAELATWGRLANWATTPIHPGYQGIYAQAGSVFGTHRRAENNNRDELLPGPPAQFEARHIGHADRQKHMQILRNESYIQDFFSSRS